MDEAGGQGFDGAAAFDDQSPLPCELANSCQSQTPGLAFHETEPAARAAREREQQFVVIAP